MKLHTHEGSMDFGSICSCYNVFRRLKTVIIPQILIELKEWHKESENEEKNFRSTWKRYECLNALHRPQKENIRQMKRIKEKLLGQHGTDNNVSMPCVIPKRKTQDNWKGKAWILMLLYLGDRITIFALSFKENPRYFMNA